MVTQFRGRVCCRLLETATRLMISICMQKRAGLLFLSKTTSRILLILENSKWTVPTFARTNGLLADAAGLFSDYHEGKVVPIELYLSEDRGFEYGTYICLTEREFIPGIQGTFAWAEIGKLPGHLHIGLKNTLNNNLIKTKIETVLELENAISK